MAITHWILVANASEARLFAAHKLGDSQNWQLLQEFAHPASRERDLELVTDKPGRYQNQATSGHGAFVEPTAPKEIEAERFALQLANELNAGRVHNLYQQLMIVAPPHFHGLLNKHCDSNVLNLVVKHVPKDYTKLRVPELVLQLKEV